RVAITEHPQLPCRLVDLATGSDTEIAALAAELEGEGSGEDEIALHGELRYVRRLEPVSLNTLSGMGPGQASDARAFRFEIGQRGILDSLSARPLARSRPGPGQIEIEVVAVGLNFKDLMTSMGLVPPDAIHDGSGGKLIGLECAGLVCAVGDRVEALSVGDEVGAVAPGCLASHITVDQAFVARKPGHLTFEQ